ncbi:MAG TPA: cell division protein ZapA [Desulfotomaculum sp.]|nr:cell division protein ZapA [Desulfotomaculum sp.]
MQAKENRVEVEIGGEPYILRSEAPAEHIKRVARLVNNKIKEVRVRNSRLSLVKATVAAALNIADDYLRLKDEHEEMVKLIESERVK